MNNFDQLLGERINPLKAEIGSRTLSIQVCFPDPITAIIPLTAIRFSIYNGQTFTLADIAALSTSGFLLKGIILIVGVVSCILFGTWIFRLNRSLKTLSYIAKNASLCNRPLQNPLLLRKMKHIQLMVSSNIEIPCAFGVFRKRICFPTELIDKLSQMEFEAIIAHELDHLHWYDSIVRALSHGICSVFWWIPATWWINLLERSQESSCDAKIHQFNIDKLDLASAIIKTAKVTKSSTVSMLSSCFIKEGLMRRRLQSLLEEPARKKGRLRWIKIALVTAIAMSFLLGKRLTNPSF